MSLKDKHLEGIMDHIRTMRRWAVENHVGPWVVRQGLITAIAFDTDAAYRHGVTRAELDRFDALATDEAAACLQRIKAKLDESGGSAA